MWNSMSFVGLVVVGLGIAVVNAWVISTHPPDLPATTQAVSHMRAILEARTAAIATRQEEIHEATMASLAVILQEVRRGRPGAGGEDDMRAAAAGAPSVA